jgi:hypothetical protein
MSQSSGNQYDVHVIIKDGKCTIIPSQIQGNITRLCIGYIRAAVAYLDKSTTPPTMTIYYTGNPCHRTWVILSQSQVQSQGQQQTSQTQSQSRTPPKQYTVNTNDYPIVDLLACFDVDRNNKRLKSVDTIDRVFNIQFNFQQLNFQFKIYDKGGSIPSEECKTDELEQELEKSLHLQSIDLSQLMRSIPSKIYVVK